MKLKNWSYLLLACLCVILSACKKDFSIEEPVKDKLYNEFPESYVIGYKSKPSELPKIELNGFDVASHFSMGPDVAEATGAALAEYLVQGTNIFALDPPLGASVKFTYDTEGPSVFMLESSEEGADIKIMGVVEDPAGIKSLSYENTAIEFDRDGEFTLVVPKKDIYTFQASDLLDREKTTQFAKLGLTYNPSLTVKVTQEGIQTALDAIANQINGVGINNLAAGTEIVNETVIGPGGETTGSDASIKSLNVGVSDLSIDFKNGPVDHYRGEISSIEVVIVAREHNGQDPMEVDVVKLAVGPIIFDGDLELQVQNNAPSVELSNFTVDIGQVDITTGNVFTDSFIIDKIAEDFGNRSEGVLAEGIKAAVNEQFPKLFENIIKNSYTIDMPINAESYELTVALGLESLVTTDDELLIRLSGGVAPINPDLDIPQSLAGALYFDDVLPDGALHGGNFAFAMNSNTFNQVLASAHALGLTHMNIVGDETQLGLPRTDEFGGEEATKRVLVDMMTPATVSVNKVADAASIKMSFHGLTLSSQTKENGAYKNDISVRLNGSVLVDLGISEQAKFSATLSSDAEFKVTGIRLGNGGWTGNVINTLADQLIARELSKVLQEIALPIAEVETPSFECLSFTPTGIKAVGGKNSHLNFSGALVKTSNACDNEPIDPPTVVYGRGVGTPMTCLAGEEYDAGLCYTPCKENYNGVGPVCWLQDASYGRGVGTVPTNCGPGKQLDAGLCYPVCRSGYNGIGPVCWSTQALSYGRGAGTIPINIWTGECANGQENQAGLCYVYCKDGYTGQGPVCWLDNASYGRGVGTVPNGCPNNNELDAGLCYPVCQSGYHGVGPVCWRNGALSYGRGVGLPIRGCPAGQELDAGLCYEECDEGYDGVGPVCWPTR